MQEEFREDLRDLPFGPLHPETFKRLGAAYYDTGNTEIHKIAAKRGIMPGDSVRFGYAEKLAARQDRPLWDVYAELYPDETLVAPEHLDQSS